MKNLKDQKGITLVALVITIIVLLILAGVSLSLVVGDNGILGRATNSSEQQKAAAVREQVELDIAKLATDFYEAKYVSKTLDADKTIADFIVDSFKTGENGATVGRKLPNETSATGAYIVKKVNNDYVVTMLVYNAQGTSTKEYTSGKIDANGKWLQDIVITSGKVTSLTNLS